MQWAAPRGRPIALAGAREDSVRVQKAVGAVLANVEQLGDLRVAQRLARVVGEQILLRDVGDVLGLGVLGEQMVERLILLWPRLGRDREPPFLRVVEDWVDVEDETAEVVDPMAHYLANPVLGAPHLSHAPPSLPCTARSIAAGRC